MTSGHQPVVFPARQSTRNCLIAGVLTLAFALTGCGDKPPANAAPVAAPPAAAPAGAAPPADAAPSAAAPAPLAPTATTWTPEALEELLAPIALYPEVVLGQMLASATNPQEVLDAGNWLLQNQKLEGKARDEAAKTVGFTAPVRVLLQSPEVIDLMCMQLDWTTELGQAFVNDQVGVLDAIQRLRAQAKEAGNLKSSDKMTVETKEQDGKEVITLTPPTSEVVYVPQYDPVTVYAAPAAAPVAAAPATTAVAQETGYSTGAMVTTGLLAFGGGLLVANLLDDDDDDDNYYPSYYGSSPPYYPPPYRPSYGNGYYPGNSYQRPPGYNRGFNNNNTVIVNNNDYWKRQDGKYNDNKLGRKADSPITAARPNRSELNSLNARAKDQPQRAAQSDAWKGQNAYGGAKPGARDTGAAARPGAAGGQLKTQPKLQGSYAGGKATSARPAVNNPASARQRPSTQPPARPASKPATGAARPAASDRGRQTAPSRSSRPSAPARAPEQNRSSALSGANRSGASDRAASQRGRQSMPKGVPAKSKGSGGSRNSGGSRSSGGSGGSGGRGGRGR